VKLIFFPGEESAEMFGGAIKLELPGRYNDAVKIAGNGLQDFDLAIRPVGAKDARIKRIGMNKVKYSEAYQNTDVVQTQEKRRLKEDIILKGPGHPKQFEYEINLDDFTYKIDEQGDIHFYEKYWLDGTRELFVMKAPFMEKRRISTNQNTLQPGSGRANFTNHEFEKVGMGLVGVASAAEVDGEIQNNLSNQKTTSDSEMGFGALTGASTGLVNLNSIIADRNILSSVSVDNSLVVEVRGVEPPRRGLTSPASQPATPITSSLYHDQENFKTKNTSIIDGDVSAEASLPDTYNQDSIAKNFVKADGVDIFDNKETSSIEKDSFTGSANNSNFAVSHPNDSIAYQNNLFNNHKTTNDVVAFGRPTDLPVGKPIKLNNSIAYQNNLSRDGLCTSQGVVETGGVEPPRRCLMGLPGKPAALTTDLLYHNQENNKIVTRHSLLVTRDDGNDSHSDQLPVTSDKGQVEVKIEGNKLILIPDESWLASHEYPIIIDPTIEITILNVQSYPTVGGEWKVGFTTRGTADLKITGIDGTFFAPAGSEERADLEFLSLTCGEESFTPAKEGNS